MMEALGKSDVMKRIQAKKTENEKNTQLSEETYKVVKKVLDDILPKKHDW